MIHARKPELKSEPTWNNSSVKSYPEIQKAKEARQFSQALFTKVEHSDRSDEGLGSRLQ